VAATSREVFNTAMLDLISAQGTALLSATETAPAEKSREKTTHEPQYKVILYNDDQTPMEHVVRVLQKVIPRMNEKKATAIMLQAHTEGKAVVIKCHKELAEMYCEGLRSEELISTIEPEE